MKFKELFEFIIAQGISQDPRGAKAVAEQMAENAEKYAKLSGKEKERFDVAKFTNPYADSRMLNGIGNEEVKTILFGIDIETAEVLLANALNATGKKIDLIITHHPEGKAYATFAQVMGMQADILNKFGVPLNVSESLTNAREKEVSRKVLSANHTRAVDAAVLLGIPFMSAHTVADNHVVAYLQKLFDESKPKNLGAVVDMLFDIAEYKYADSIGAGPIILNGSAENRTGKIFVDMTGGTEGSKDLIEKLSQAGVGTMVCMHMSEEHYKNAQKHHINVVIAGHISSDNLGINLMLDAVEKKFGKIETVECSGFKRFRRI